MPLPQHVKPSGNPKTYGDWSSGRQHYAIETLDQQMEALTRQEKKYWYQRQSTQDELEVINEYRSMFETVFHNFENKAGNNPISIYKQNMAALTQPNPEHPDSHPLPTSEKAPAGYVQARAAIADHAKAYHQQHAAQTIDKLNRAENIIFFKLEHLKQQMKDKHLSPGIVARELHIQAIESHNFLAQVHQENTQTLIDGSNKLFDAAIKLAKGEDLGELSPYQENAQRLLDGLNSAPHVKPAADNETSVEVSGEEEALLTVDGEAPELTEEPDVVVSSEKAETASPQAQLVDQLEKLKGQEQARIQRESNKRLKDSQQQMNNIREQYFYQLQRNVHAARIYQNMNREDKARVQKYLDKAAKSGMSAQSALALSDRPDIDPNADLASAVHQAMKDAGGRLGEAWTIDYHSDGNRWSCTTTDLNDVAMAKAADDLIGSAAMEGSQEHPVPINCKVYGTEQVSGITVVDTEKNQKMAALQAAAIVKNPCADPENSKIDIQVGIDKDGKPKYETKTVKEILRNPEYTQHLPRELGRDRQQPAQGKTTYDYLMDVYRQRPTGGAEVRYASDANFYQQNSHLTGKFAEMKIEQAENLQQKMATGSPELQQQQQTQEEHVTAYGSP